MEYRRLGRTGITVSSLCLGAMMFGEWGTRDHDESIKIIHRALDAGINFIDTADVYSAGESEVIVGKAMAGGRRDDIVLASKVHMPMGEDPNQRTPHPSRDPRKPVRSTSKSRSPAANPLPLACTAFRVRADHARSAR